MTKIEDLKGTLGRPDINEKNREFKVEFLDVQT